MDVPGVDILLAIDGEYRERAHAGSLPLIAPRRLNPEGKAWLPVLHKRYAPWHFTALFSNTERAHLLHRVYDWVVIFYEGADGTGQATVVTERRGALTGERVVRGREPECALLPRRAPTAGDADYPGRTREPSLSASGG